MEKIMNTMTRVMIVMIMASLTARFIDSQIASSNFSNVQSVNVESTK